MTVSTTHFENSHTPSGGTTFAFTFRVLSADHVKLYLDDELVQDSLYTVTLNASGVGGVVEFDDAPVGDELIVRRETPRTQATSFPFGGKFSTLDVENAFDRLTLVMQEIIDGIIGPEGPEGPEGEAGTDGEMTGPDSSTDNALVVFDGTDGTTVKVGPAPTNEGDTIVVSGGQWVATAGAATIPSGLRAFWGDPDVIPIPTGWEPMDGREVTINGNPYTTPDTRGKYLMCASLDDTGSSGFTGATAEPDTISGAKTHSHENGGTVTTGAATPGGTVSTSGVSVQAGVHFSVAVNGSYGVSGGSHSHSASISGNTAANSEASRPIEVAQLMIIKVDE